VLLLDGHDFWHAWRAQEWIERHFGLAKQIRQHAHSILATRGTLIQTGSAGCQRLGIGPAAWVAAALALGLRQNRVDPVCQRESVHALPRARQGAKG
jgi:hypothetical protein